MASPFLSLFLLTTFVGPQQFVTQRVSLDSSGKEAVGSSLNPSLSDDGRHLGFQSTAPLDALASDFTDVYVRDRISGTTTLVSFGQGGVAANSFSSDAHLSSDGRFVVFASSASNLVANDTNGFDDIFLADRDPDQNGTLDEGNLLLMRVSLGAGAVEPNAPCSSPTISGDGRWVCFASLATNLTPGDINGFSDVFAWDRTTGDLALLSVDHSGQQGDGPSSLSAISSDGRYVAFESLSTNLVAFDGNGVRDVFLRDRDPDQNGIFDEPSATTTLISVSTLGVQANASSGSPAISGDGDSVAFQSTASNLAAGTTSGASQVYVRMRSGSRTELVSRGFSGSPGNDTSTFPAISTDGSTIAFESRATNLVPGDTNGWDDVFRVDLVGATVARVSVGVPGTESSLYSQRPALNVDGSEIAFQSPANDLVAYDNNGSFDVFVRSSGSWSPQTLLDPLVRGSSAAARVCNAKPGESVVLTYSTAGLGAGPCPPQLGGLCMDILNPSLYATATATLLGDAEFPITVPNGAPLTSIYVQAVIARGIGGSRSVKSNVAIETIRP